MIKKILKKILAYIGYNLVKVNKVVLPQDSEFKIYRQITDIPGFLSFQAFKLFSCLRQITAERNDSLQKQGVLEIGVYCGMSLLGLSLIYIDQKITGVDPFFESFDDSSFDNETDFLKRKSGNLSGKDRLDKLKKKSKSLNIQDRLLVLKMTQEEYFEKIEPTKFQLIYADGEHTYTSIKTLLNKADHLLSPNGFLVFDDFLSNGFPGISEAVHTHPYYKTSLFPVCYAFNKAVFLYKPSKEYLIAIIDKINSFAKHNNYEHHRCDSDNSIIIT